MYVFLPGTNSLASCAATVLWSDGNYRISNSPPQFKRALLYISKSGVCFYDHPGLFVLCLRVQRELDLRRSKRYNYIHYCIIKYR